MDFFYILKHLLPPLIRIFTKHGQGSFVFTGSDHFKVDIFFLEQTMKVGYLNQHTNGAYIGKRCGYKLTGYTGHHIATTSSNFVDTDSQRNIFTAHAVKLGGSQTIGMYHAARAFKTQKNFIFFYTRHGKNGSDSLA